MEWFKSPLLKSPEERYVDIIKELDSIVLGFKKDLDKANKEIESKDSRLLEYSEALDKQIAKEKSFSDFTASITPTQVYHNKKRGNTTVKFMDGKSVTVHKMKNDKDCLETAIVYAIYKKLYSKKLLELLVKTVKETGGEECKKH